MKKKIHLFLFNGFSDWEIAFLTPELNKSERFELVYFSINGLPVTSMGGLQVSTSKSLTAIKYDDVDVLILPGGTAWEKGENTEISDLVRHVFNKNKAIAAICAATTFLAQIELLDKLKHTSNDLAYLKACVPTYQGEANYQNTLATTDKNIITANGIAPIEFSREIFRTVKLFSDEDLEKWFQLFKNGIWSE